MKNIVRLASVSTSTVSRVINNDRDVSPQVRQRFEEAMQTAGRPSHNHPLPQRRVWAISGLNLTLSMKI